MVTPTYARRRRGSFCDTRPVRGTPYVWVDEQRLDANIAAMQAFCADSGIALRPHAKTHKSLTIARKQLEAGAVGLTVATVGEAEVFADVLAEFGKDVLIAYPVATDAGRIRRLAARVPVIIGVDSARGIHRAAEAGVAVSIEIDCGLRRSGVAPDRVGELVSVALSCGVGVVGVFTFPGHGYGRDGARSQAAADEARALAAAATSATAAGVSSPVVSGGCTPTATLAHADVVTELRPGVYVFMDAGQVAIGTASLDQVALGVRATVVSAAVPGQVVLDAGAKLLGMDRPPWVDAHGYLPAYPHARLARIWEHHGVLEVPAGSPAPELGEQVDVIPNHVCATVNLVDEFVVGDVTWPVNARGRNG
jgi:D-serine deaminase-like pyridoxal phosphate-dependent protein